MKPLRRLYGETAAAEFDAVALEVVRDEMVKLGWCRTNINRQILRIKSIFGWAVGRKLVPPGINEILDAVKGCEKATPTRAKAVA